MNPLHHAAHFLRGIVQKSWGHWGQIKKCIQPIVLINKFCPQNFGDKRFWLGDIGDKLPYFGDKLAKTGGICLLFKQNRHHQDKKTFVQFLNLLFFMQQK